MTPPEAAKIRKAIMKNIVEGVYHTYVYNNEVISNTSNWIGHIRWRSFNEHGCNSR